MPRNRSRPAREGAQRRRGEAPATSDAAVLRALKIARVQLLKHAGVEDIAAVDAINKALEPHEQHKKFEVTLTAVIEMEADCPDQRLQVGQAFTEYLVNGLHLDANYIAEAITYREIP